MVSRSAYRKKINIIPLRFKESPPSPHKGGGSLLPLHQLYFSLI